MRTIPFIYKVFIITTLMLAVSCSNGPTAVKPFALPSVPSLLQTEEERTEYLCAHFWDNLDAADTLLLNDRTALEDFFVMYVSLLGQQDKAAAARNVRSFLYSKIGDNESWAAAIMELATKYLYHVHSPLLNEELYIPFAQYAVERSFWNEADAMSFAFSLDVAQANRPGSVAADFSFVTADGEQRNMHSLQARYLLLFFNDPECDVCRGYKEALSSNGFMRALVEGGMLLPLMVYTEGVEDVWQQHKDEHPEGWLSVFDCDESIRMQRIYNLRAMPSLYLLDKDKSVIFKDIALEPLLAYFKKLCIESSRR